MKIESKDISVIVQGHIQGLSTDAYEDRWTYLSLESIRKFLPDAEIILSTFKGCDVKDLPYDIVIQNDDPGYLDLGEMNKMLGNTNRQIVTTQAGLRKATRKFALKMRYDLVMKGIGFLNYFGIFNERMDTWKILKKRVIGCTSVSINPRKLWAAPFAPSDWFHFGLLADVKNLWDIPLIPEPEVVDHFQVKLEGVSKYSAPHYYTAEQYIWLSFLRKYGEIYFSHANDLSHDSMALTDQTIANNLVLLEPGQISLKCMKYYDENLPTYSKTINYTYSEWFGLYEKYCLRKYFQTLGLDHGSLCLPISAGFNTDPQSNGHLLNTAAEIIRNAGEVSFRTLETRLDDRKRRLINLWPGENYKLLAALVRYINPSLIVEFGMGGGLTTLCLREFMEKGSYLVTINHDFCNWKGYAHSLLMEKDFEYGAIVEHKLDISLSVNLEEVVSTALNADLIVFNLEDGLLLEKILKVLPHMDNSHCPWLIINNIRQWTVAPVWNNISRPKLDLTSFGHRNGIGLVAEQKPQ